MALLRVLRLRFAFLNASGPSKLYCTKSCTKMQNFKATLDADTLQRLDKCIAEYELMKFADSQMPSKVTPEQWQRLLRMRTNLQRLKYFTYLHTIEQATVKDEEHENLKIEAKQKFIDAARREIRLQKEKHIHYGFSGNCILSPIRQYDMNRQLNARLARAMTYGPHLIFDMSFFPYLSPLETNTIVRQFFEMHGANRAHLCPHHIIFSECRPDDISWQDADRFITREGGARLYTVTEKSYLDLFPKKRLVYLSPHAKVALTEYDPSKTYVIGAVIDKQQNSSFLMAKAKQKGVETRRIPVERCVRLIGSKYVALNHIVNILNDAHAYGSITKAVINNVPKRKLVPKSSEMPRIKRKEIAQRFRYLQAIGE